MSKETPYFAVGNNELKGQPKVGNTATCPNCGEDHKVKYAKDAKTGKETKMLGIVDCPKSKKSYLIAINQKLLK